ncbi:helix-turn-helix transcriptional regulator [Microbacteriaceae bacterium VKM Ac-2855]|nr:helix-turn-helix transcriptional regulator [Microbacteriaceae bacterium VKM Ac-2855]
MKRQIEYQWRVRELMARHGMRNSRDLVGPLRERDITLSESQIYRLVGQDPERIAFKVLTALCDVFGVEANELITYTAANARTTARDRAVGEDAPPAPLSFRPVRARILDDDD